MKNKTLNLFACSILFMGAQQSAFATTAVDKPILPVQRVEIVNQKEKSSSNQIVAKKELELNSPVHHTAVNLKHESADTSNYNHQSQTNHTGTKNKRNSDPGDPIGVVGFFVDGIIEALTFIAGVIWVTVTLVQISNE